ncbi:hypothetical protein N2152v2_008987 [Parachlorella kessleri]
MLAVAGNLLLENTNGAVAHGDLAGVTPQPLAGVSAALKHAKQPPLFEGAPSLAEVLERASKEQPVFEPATVELYSLHCRSLNPSGEAVAPLRAAALRGNSVVACVQEQQAWCKFDFEGQIRTGRGRLIQSACSCGYADYGVLWCSHRRDAAAALAGPGSHILDLDGLEQLLCPLPPIRLAQLLLQLALVTQSIPELVSALSLQPSTVFLDQLGGLPLTLPAASYGKPGSVQALTLADVQRRIREVARQTEAYLRESATSLLASMHTKLEDALVPLGVLDVRRFALFPAERGCLADAVAAAVKPMSPLDVCHDRGFGIDAGDFHTAMPDNWLQSLNFCERTALATPQQRSIPLWKVWLLWLQQQTTRVQKGSLLQLTARQLARAFLDNAPFEAQGRYSSLIPDLQELVAAEGASLLLARLEPLCDAPWLVDEELRGGLPDHLLRNHFKSDLKEFLVGHLSIGADLNTGGLHRDEQPADLPPSTQAAPFDWVTVRVRELLASPNPRHQAWAGAYLLLIQGSPAEQPAGQLWRWVCDSSFIDWVAEAFMAQHTPSGVKFLLVRVLERLSQRARSSHRGRPWLDASAQLPSRQFVAKAERLSLRIMQTTAGTVEALLSKREEQDSPLTYSASLRFLIQQLSSLLHLVDDLQYWRVEVAAAEAKQAHPAPQHGEQVGGETETRVVPDGVLLGQPALGKEEGMGEEPAPQGNQMRQAGQGQPQGAAWPALERCRTLLADMVNLRSKDSAGQGSGQAQSTLQRLRQQRHWPQVQPPPQPGQQQGPGRGLRQRQLEEQQQVEHREEACGSQAGLAAGGPLSAEDAGLLLRRLEAVSLQSHAAEALRDLVMLTGPGGALRSIRAAGSVPDLGLLRAKTFCDAIERDAPEPGSMQTLLLTAARVLLRLVVASYSEAVAQQQRGHGEGLDIRPRQAFSTLWTRQELYVYAADPSYPSLGAAKLPLPQLLQPALVHLVELLEAPRNDCSGLLDGRPWGEQLAELPSLLVEAAEALEGAEGREGLPVTDRTRAAAKAAAELLVSLMRKVVTQDPAALQQLAASPATLNFLVSPMMERIEVAARSSIYTAKEPVGVPIMQLVAGLVETAGAALVGATGIADAGPATTVAAAAPAEVPTGAALESSTAPSCPGKRGARCTTASQPQPAAKRPRTSGRNAAADDEEAGCGVAPPESGAVAAGPPAVHPAPAAGVSLQGACSPELLLQAAGACQAWLASMQGIIQAMQEMSVHAPQLLRPGLLGAMRGLQWWADSRHHPALAAKAPRLGLEDVQLAACRLLSTLGQQDPEGLARSKHVSKLYKALAMPTGPGPGEVVRSTGTLTTVDTTVPAEALGLVKASSAELKVDNVLPQGVRAAVRALEQDLRRRLVQLSPTWTTVLDSHKDNAERGLAPLGPEAEAEDRRMGAAWVPPGMPPQGMWDHDDEVSDEDAGFDEDGFEDNGGHDYDYGMSDSSDEDEELEMEMAWEEQQAAL